jgi:hypothetical protein
VDAGTGFTARIARTRAWHRIVAGAPNRAAAGPITPHFRRREIMPMRSTTPVTFWVGSNHGASIVKLEPLD